MQRERANFVYGNEEEGVRGCVNNGISADAANIIFDKMIDFAKYAFNKSHAAAYAIIAYQTAWLKAYYPVEFMAALLTSVMFGGGKVAEYIYTLKGMGIDVLPPDINEGYYNFSVSDGKIRFGLAAVKNVGRGVIDHMVKEREENGKFISLTDYCSRMDQRDLNKRVIENLIKAGAFQSLGGTRKQYMQYYKQVVESITHSKKSTIQGQINLFDLNDDMQDTKLDDFPEVSEYGDEQLLLNEKEVLGIYLSGHPLEQYQEVISSNTSCKSLDFMPLEDGTFKLMDGGQVLYAGIINNKVVKTTRNNQTMAFITVEDMFGAVEVVVFPKDYEVNRHFLNEDEVVMVKGRVSTQEDQDGKIVCREIRKLDDMIAEKVYVQFEDMDDYTDTIRKISPYINNPNGTSLVYAYLKDTKSLNRFGNTKRMMTDSETLSAIVEIMGKENVKVKKTLLKM